MAKTIHCAKCFQEITDPYDLMVVAKLGLVLRPYHTRCYGEREKTLAHHWLTTSRPVNHRPGTVAAFVGALFVLFAILLMRTANWERAIIVGLFGLWPVALRISSYVLYERPLILRERRQA